MPPGIVRQMGLREARAGKASGQWQHALLAVINDDGFSTGAAAAGCGGVDEGAVIVSVITVNGQ